jgi:hypothetical protein
MPIKKDKLEFEEPGLQDNAVELIGLNFSVMVRSMDPDVDLKAMGSLALNLYKRLMALERV